MAAVWGCYYNSEQHRNGKINALQEDVSIGMNHAELRIGTSTSIYRPLEINDLAKIQLKSRKL